MAERSCVHSYIERVQKNIRNGGTINQSFELIDQYQASLKHVYGNNRAKLHRALTSTPSLKSIALYEHLRSRGLPLPDSRQMISTALPIKRRCRVILGGPDLIDTKVYLLDKN